ncbi:hypothetical protein TI05_15115, partial [Achromatium sp. WMS3]
MSAGGRHVRRRLNVWPGYVDVLSSLLILVIFVLMIFTFAQFILSQKVSNQESELGNLHKRIAELTKLLGLEQQKNLKLSENIEQLSAIITALTEEKFELTGKIESLSTLVKDRDVALDKQHQLNSEAQAQVLLLNQQLKALRSQLQEIAQALKVSEQDKANKQVQIEDLNNRLNIALARKVNRLEQYRSEFFGRLRKVLAGNTLVRIVGDRFMFQSELLFGSGSATLDRIGKTELAKLAKVLKELIVNIPQDIDWILQVEGHTDKVPIKTHE